MTEYGTLTYDTQEEGNQVSEGQTEAVTKKRKKTQKELEDQLEKAQTRLDALKAQLRQKEKEKRARDNKTARSKRNHALMVIGGMVEKHLPDQSWTNTDWDMLARCLDINHDQLAGCRAEALEPVEAAHRLKAWERDQRTVKTSGRHAAESEQPTQYDYQEWHVPENNEQGGW